MTFSITRIADILRRTDRKRRRSGQGVISRSKPLPPWRPVKEVPSLLPFCIGRSTFLPAPGQFTWTEL